MLSVSTASTPAPRRLCSRLFWTVTRGRFLTGMAAFCHLARFDHDFSAPMQLLTSVPSENRLAKVVVIILMLAVAGTSPALLSKCNLTNSSFVDQSAASSLASSRSDRPSSPTTDSLIECTTGLLPGLLWSSATISWSPAVSRDVSWYALCSAVTSSSQTDVSSARQWMSRVVAVFGQKSKSLYQRIVYVMIQSGALYLTVVLLQVVLYAVGVVSVCRPSVFAATHLLFQ